MTWRKSQCKWCNINNWRHIADATLPTTLISDFKNSDTNKGQGTFKCRSKSIGWRCWKVIGNGDLGHGRYYTILLKDM